MEVRGGVDSNISVRAATIVEGGSIPISSIQEGSISIGVATMEVRGGVASIISVRAASLTPPG